MNLDISIKGGRCKVTDGDTKRVFNTTEESLGLYLLKLNPQAEGRSGAIRWVDQLGKRGIAVGHLGDETYTLTVFPAQKREILFGRGDTTRRYTVTLPEIFLPAVFAKGKLRKALMMVVKPGQTERLAVGNTDGQLAYYSYGNVYNHGGICWGSTPTRELQTVDDVYDAFFGSAFNGDLYAYNSVGLLNFLEGLTGPDKVFPRMADGLFTLSVQAAIQGLAR